MAQEIFHSTYYSDRNGRKNVVDDIYRHLSGALGSESRLIKGGELYLAIDEAITNAMEHGNSWDPTRRVTVALSRSESSLLISVEDEGKGFDHNGHLAGMENRDIMSKRGRGIYIISKFCKVSWNSRGNIIYLTVPL